MISGFYFTGPQLDVCCTVCSTRYSHLSTLGDYHITGWFTFTADPRVLDLSYNIHTVDDLAKDDVLVIQEWCCDLR